MVVVDEVELEDADNLVVEPDTTADGVGLEYVVASVELGVAAVGVVLRVDTTAGVVATMAAAGTDDTTFDVEAGVKIGVEVDVDSMDDGN